ncbi:hypothetical protein ABBQ38_006029 [Trebouxia sp. C0009 RCD-2024]
MLSRHTLHAADCSVEVVTDRDLRWTVIYCLRRFSAATLWLGLSGVLFASELYLHFDSCCWSLSVPASRVMPEFHCVCGAGVDGQRANVEVPQDVTAYEDRIQVDEWQKRGTVHCYVFVLLVDVVPVP